MSAPKKGDLSASEKELFEVITAGKLLRLTLILLETTQGLNRLFLKLWSENNKIISNYSKTYKLMLSLLLMTFNLALSI